MSATLTQGDDPRSILSIENLLNLLVCEYQKSRYAPMGWPLNGVRSEGNEMMISIKPLCMYQDGCPSNFGCFHEKAKSLDGMKKRGDAFLWYCRTRLHYSCSSSCVIFTEFIVPELKKHGIDSLCVSGTDPNVKVCLDKIKVKEIHFHPKDGRIHSLHMVWGLGTERLFQIETGSHNVLECSETGRVFDPTLGQLSGSMKPSISFNFDEYEAEFVGDIYYSRDSSDAEIQGQKARDVVMAKSQKKTFNVEIHPLEIAKRVVESFLDSSSYIAMFCNHCLGAPSAGRKLLRCSQCKLAYYCCKICQEMDWPSHKNSCKLAP